MKPIPLSSGEQIYVGDIWEHASGCTRIVLAVDGAWIRFQGSLATGECHLKNWRAWTAQARLVSRFGVRR